MSPDSSTLGIMSEQHAWIKYGKALAGVAVVTLVWRILLSDANFLAYGESADVANVTTVALSYLLVVLFTASRHGLAPGVLASILGMVCLDYFFLPPIYELNYKDPHDWLALAGFLVTANIASQLWAASRTREREARWRREQALKLYALSCSILGHVDSESLLTSLAKDILEAFACRYCGVFHKDESGGWKCVSAAHSAGPGSVLPVPGFIEEVSRTGSSSSIPTQSPRRPKWQIVRRTGNRAVDEVSAYVPSKVGDKVVAVLVLVYLEGMVESTNAVAALVALALERAKLLDEIRVKDSLRLSDKLKSALLASVSHNLRTPLTSIRASVEGILSTETGGRDPILHELHMIISEEVNRLTRIVDHLLEMARVEAGELRLKKEWTSAQEIFDSALRDCEAAVRHHATYIDCPETLPLVMVDPRRMTEVLVNLIDNAAKYSPPGSTIAVSARMDGQVLRISVEDHGPGVAPEDVERIFDKFYRGAQSGHQQAKEGTGMGLAIARGLVEAHEGSIWVESTAGKGATFVFTVPAEQTAEETHMPAMNNP